MRRFSELIQINKVKYNELVITKNDENLRLDRFITNKYNIQWDTLQKYLRNSDIFILRQNQKIKIPKEKLILSDKVYVNKRIVVENNNNKVSYNLDKEIQNNLENLFKQMIVFESKQLLVINKMYNLASQNGTSLKFSIDTMLDLINKKNEKSDLKLVHRLDKSVSGLMIIGNELETVRKLGEDIKMCKIEKTYLTITQNIPIYLRKLIELRKLNVNDTTFFCKSMSGNIKSSEDCDDFQVELDNKSTFQYDPMLNDFTFRRTTTIASDYAMSGKFKITHFIFYDKTKKEFKPYSVDVEEYTKHSFNTLEALKGHLEAENIECYSVVAYELVSGKKHQIRKHMSKCLFSPILNDSQYMWDREKSSEVMKILNIEEVETDPFKEKFKINNIKESIFLQSVKISLPQHKLTNTEYKNSQVKFMKGEDSMQIKMLKLNNNFEKLFRGMKMSRLINIENYNI